MFFLSNLLELYLALSSILKDENNSSLRLLRHRTTVARSDGAQIRGCNSFGNFVQSSGGAYKQIHERGFHDRSIKLYS